MCDHKGIRGESAAMVTTAIVTDTEVIVTMAEAMTDVHITKTVTMTAAAVIGMPAKTVMHIITPFFQGIARSSQGF